MHVCVRLTCAQLRLLDDTLGWHAKGLGHGDEVGVDVRLVVCLVPLCLTLAQVRVRAVGLCRGAATTFILGGSCVVFL